MIKSSLSYRNSRDFYAKKNYYRLLPQWVFHSKFEFARLLLALIFIVSMPVMANTPSGWTGFRNVIDFGCHNVDGTCYVTIDGSPVSGGLNCTSNSVRWDSKNDPNGRTWLVLLLVAKASNFKIGLNINKCYANQQSYPTFNYGSIE